MEKRWYCLSQLLDIRSREMILEAPEDERICPRLSVRNANRFHRPLLPRKSAKSENRALAEDAGMCQNVRVN
jgi:hypothetical protein